MNRIIKFRGLCSCSRTWVYGDLSHTQKICSVEEKSMTGKMSLPVIRVAGLDAVENTIGQFTGMLDENGKEIYDGDIVEYYDKKENISHRFKVVYFQGVFGLENNNVSNQVTPLCSHIMSRYVVIGDIHNNPELLN